MVKGFWASSSGTPAFSFQKERAGSATRPQLTTLLPVSFKIFLTFWEIFLARLAPGIRPGGFWREKHFRLRDAPPSPLRYDAIAPKPEAKAEKRRFGATAVRLVTSAATGLGTFLELTLAIHLVARFAVC